MMESRLSIEDLKQKRRRSLAAADEAARMHPEEYRVLREQVRHVVASTIDITHYGTTARKIAGLLETLTRACPGSLFAYFHENIDPRRSGRPDDLRAMCRDLDQQMKCIERFGSGDEKQRVISPECFRKTETNGESGK